MWCNLTATGRCQALRGGLVAFALLALAGCGRIGIPLGTAELADNARPQDGRVALVSASDGVDPSDWETVRQTVARSVDGTGIDWSNPLTGSSGTLLSFDGESDCRTFATTMSDMRGIRRYRGAACQASGEWRLTEIVPDDAQLL